MTTETAIYDLSALTTIAAGGRKGLRTGTTVALCAPADLPAAMASWLDANRTVPGQVGALIRILAAAGPQGVRVIDRTRDGDIDTTGVNAGCRQAGSRVVWAIPESSGMPAVTPDYQQTPCSVLLHYGARLLAAGLVRYV